MLNWETKDYEWMTLEDLYKLEPKHFGLKELLNKAQNQIEKISQSPLNKFRGLSCET